VFESVAAYRPEGLVTVEEVRKILADFVARDLMLQEGNLYLSLAVLPLDSAGIEMPPQRAEVGLSAVAV
jgi:hypothetical protein